ncbi:Fatty acid hydroxylase superfamily protein [Lishizhenia tianjinensis]|uniref:Fatty acid hydroxylase superfamily protein n=1 Tax=Lishizhenia tianjinensis TaxID=477690 RepID=A0A1I7AKT6_9FLAO|nr:sterol desaturase family protein [Lishizhenia tianjinensis]SFT75510.1 Fatty acid hydroxylase superfamily protein [Lishizhenia tianjinensis]
MNVKIFPNKKSPRLFSNNFLELLTWSHPLLIFSMYSVIAYFLMNYFINELHHTLGSAVGYFFLGLFSWTLAEYFMHRFLYHKIKDASFSSGFQYMFHGIHHEYPNDEGRIVLPPVPSLIIASLFFLVFYLFLGETTYAFGPGFMIGYSLYMSIHNMVHKRPSPKKYNFWWRHHNIHHFQQHDKAFGVSTSLWDRVFGTMPEKNRRTVYAEDVK